VFRRIELITSFSLENTNPLLKTGLMGPSYEPVVDTWINKLRGPNRHLPTNCRFFFTELGWREVGRSVVEACGQTGQKYKIVAVKETDADVIWRDRHTGFEVAVQPKPVRLKGKVARPDPA
jgi:hypothetical protein